MYRMNRQMRIDDFSFPYGQLNRNADIYNIFFRDMGFIVSIIRGNGIKVSEKYSNLLNTISTLYEQQLYMLENNAHTVEDRIVSISQP